MNERSRELAMQISPAEAQNLAASVRESQSSAAIELLRTALAKGAVTYRDKEAIDRQIALAANGSASATAANALRQAAKVQ